MNFSIAEQVELYQTSCVNRSLLYRDSGVLCKDVKVLQLDLSITHMNKCVIIKQKAMNIRQLFRGRRRMQQC